MVKYAHQRHFLKKSIKYTLIFEFINIIENNDQQLEVF
jgi:hypothetical protein